MKSPLPVNDLELDLTLWKDGEAYDREWERIEKERERKHRYDMKTGRTNHKGDPDYKPMHLRPFVMWDGEAAGDAGYCLFGNSLGEEICKPNLTTEDCFNLMLESKKNNPYTIHMIFGGRYDFSEICRQSMPEARLRRLEILGHRVYWHGYRISKIGDKIFNLSRGGVTVTIYESFGWFHTSYIKALTKYSIGPWANPDPNIVKYVGTIAEQQIPLAVKILKIARTLHGHKFTDPEYALKYVLTDAEVVQLFKYQRGSFAWNEIELIRHYMRLEVKYGPTLMEAVRQPILTAGFKLDAWYGPSALSSISLRSAKIKRVDCPEPVIVAAQYAYAGGRFEMVRGGELAPVCTADMNSAYMTAALKLPDLRMGTWRRGKQFEPGKFAVYHIRYRSEFDPYRIYPLFRRDKDGSVTWTSKVTGWYWAPEAKLVANDPDAEFLESLIFDEDDETIRPFAFVADMYRLRKENPALDKAYKWALASIYGHLARRVGWNRKEGKPPKYHQLEWAGFITSWVRAEMFKVALSVGDKLISIDTDSVTAMCPIDVPDGIRLGEWEVKHYVKGIFYQNGIYWLHKGNEWTEGHTRGVSEVHGAAAVPPELMLTSIATGESIKLARKVTYTTLRQALNGVGKAGEWTERDGTEISFGGSGKRFHGRKCTGCRGGVHRFRLRPPRSMRDFPVFLSGDTREEYFKRVEEFNADPCDSQPHYLPWRDKEYNSSSEDDRTLARDILWVNPKMVDPEDTWVFDLPENTDPEERRATQR